MSEDDVGRMVIGNNAAEAFRRRCKEISGKLDEIAELQDEVKQLKKELKDDGYDAKAVAKVLREMRMGPEKMEQQLQLELVLDTYRKAVGLPTDLDDAQRRAADAAGSLPSDDDDDERSALN